MIEVDQTAKEESHICYCLASAYLEYKKCFHKRPSYVRSHNDTSYQSTLDCRVLIVSHVRFKKAFRKMFERKLEAPHSADRHDCEKSASHEFCTTRCNFK